MAERNIGTDVNQVEILSLSKIRGQQKVANLLKVNLEAYFQSRQTGNTGTFGPALMCGPSGTGNRADDNARRSE